MLELCKRCGKDKGKNPYKGKARQYCSKKCLTKDCIDRLRKKRKLELVILKGGCCQKCGYKKSLSALQFHHLYDKKFTVNKAISLNIKVNKIKEEIDKCLLLCANCHAEEHFGTDIF